MKHHNGTEHASKAGHSLFGLRRAVDVRDGEEEFLEMLSRSQGTIYKTCLLFTDRSAESIRDMYQEIVCTLWGAWPKFRGESATDTWVRRVALNVAVSEVRSHARRPRFVPIEDWMYNSIAEEVEKARPDYYKIIDGLEEEDRALLYLRLERQTIGEMAETLSMTEGAVKQRLYRIRKKIDGMRYEV